MKKYKMLKAWRDFGVGDVVELDEDTAKALIMAETIEEYDEVAETQKAADAAARDATIKSAVQSAVMEALKNAEGSHDGVRVRVQVTHEEADDGFGSLGEQLAAVKEFAATGKRDDRFEGASRKAAYGANETIDEDGGFLVDPDIQNELSERLYETGMLLSRTRAVNVSGNGLVWKELKDYDRTSRPVTIYWTEEAGDKTKSNPKFAEREMRLRKLAGLFYGTDELLEDVTALGSMAEGWFTQEFGFELDRVIMNGTGAGQPLGYRNSGAIVNVAKVAAQTADTINATNVSQMYARMPAYLQGGAVWLLNQDCFAQLPTMTIGDQPVWLAPSMSIKEAPGGMLLGKAALFSEHCETLGDLGDIQYVNLNEYILIRKGLLKMDTSIHVRFVQDETAFRFVLRVNGQPAWSSKVTPAKGTAYQSPFIQLAERS